MTAQLLLCTDLDRTLVPNGDAPESPDARPLFSRLVAHPEVILAYVSGRDADRVKAIIEEYSLPMPTFVVADVGTSIYATHSSNDWRRDADWDADIGRGWSDARSNRIDELLAGIDILEAQEPTKQGRFKRSFYFPADMSESDLTQVVRAQLSRLELPTSLIYSIDEPRNLGLLDVLPERANKLHAVMFLMKSLHLPDDKVLFCGDSGNDLSVLTSRVPGVLVANASSDVRNEARRLAAETGNNNRLYLARGDFLDMNGNYAAGILEGVCHFFPQTCDWITGGSAIDAGVD